MAKTVNVVVVATEIEHKFLVTGDEWRGPTGTRYLQGYISISEDCVVRIRIGGGRAYLTIKGASAGTTRAEFEYEVPQDDGQAMLKTFCHGRVVDKTRYRLPVGDFIWEVDEFHGQNRGLVLAELEVEFEGQEFPKPGWVGAEVSEDPRYTNAMLALQPFGTWA